MFTTITTLTALAALLPALSLAAPAASPDSAPASGTAFSITPAQLIAIAPKSASCPADLQFPNECQTAASAAPAINWGFIEYGITTPGEAAGLVATIALESGEFEFAVQHFPSPVPGQGTRNMQGPKFNVEYAQSLPALKASLPAGNDPAAVLALLVANIDYDFASAAWFLTTQCAPSGADDG
ncbi:hypothetical protein N7G274_009637 [Stereocaulon virgatum]|uniref:Uncharacterized protein n=1 Tax=Stereocaulon virgatum TaxID=373712 RepID=A0ABR3ZVR8_9LECA